MFGRVVLAVVLGAGTCAAKAQLITGASGSTETQLMDDAGTTDGEGNQQYTEYFGHDQFGLFASSLADSHSITDVVIPGVTGSTSGTDSASVVTTFDDGSNSAVYTANLQSASFLTTSVTSSGPWNSAYGQTSGGATVEFNFNLTVSGLMNLSGMVTAAGPYWISGVSIYDVTTGQTDAIENDLADAQLSDVQELGAGSYQFFAYLYVDTDFEFGPGEDNRTGSSASTINVKATFTADPAPEPASLIFLGSAALGLLRFGRSTSG